MTNGQRQQLQDLSRCYLQPDADNFVHWFLQLLPYSCMDKPEKKILRGLTHQYRHQIAAMKRNKRKTDGNQPEVAGNGRLPL